MGKLYANRTFLGNIALVVFFAFLVSLTFGMFAPQYAQASAQIQASEDRTNLKIDSTISITPLTTGNFSSVWFTLKDRYTGISYKTVYADQVTSPSVYESGYAFVYAWYYSSFGLSYPQDVQLVVYQSSGPLASVDITIRGPVPISGGTPAPAPAPTDPDKTIISDKSVEKQTTTTPDGKTVETFTVKTDVTTEITKAKTEGKKTVEIQVSSTATATAVINVPKEVVKSADGLNLAITTPNANLELPKALVAALVAANQDLSITVERGDAATTRTAMTGVPGTQGATVLGTPTVIKTAIKGNTTVTLPLTGITIPADAVARKAFLDSLAVFAIHSDGEKKIIGGTITYDADGNPTGISFQVDKFSTFAVVKVTKAKKVIKLTIGETQAAVDGKPYALDAKPFVKAKVNRTLVPVRFISEALGAEVDWKASTRQVVIKDGADIVLTVGSSKVQVNGLDKTLDCPAVIVNSRTFVPLRFVSETLGAKVDYEAKTKQITITR